MSLYDLFLGIPSRLFAAFCR